MRPRGARPQWTFRKTENHSQNGRSTVSNAAVMSSRSTGDPAELIRAAQRGDTRALELLAREHYPFVLKVSVRLARSIGLHLDGEDLAQQAWARAIPALPGYRGHAKFTTWLMTITRNLVFNEMRRRGRSRQVSMEGDSEHEAREFADDPTKQPAQSAVTAELEAAMNAAIAELPEPQRVALVLRRYEEMPYEEIAKVLKVSVPALKSLLFRARETLKVKLKRYLE